jgi:hypothetical protein
VAWSKDILQLLREVRFHLIRFEEDENPEELQDACNVLANVAELIGTEVVDVEPSAN